MQKETTSREAEGQKETKTKTRTRNRKTDPTQENPHINSTIEDKVKREKEDPTGNQAQNSNGDYKLIKLLNNYVGEGQADQTDTDLDHEPHQCVTVCYNQ